MNTTMLRAEVQLERGDPVKEKKLKRKNFTFRFSQALGPMVRPEPLGSEESREACKKEGLSILQHGKNEVL